MAVNLLDDVTENERLFIHDLLKALCHQGKMHEVSNKPILHVGMPFLRQISKKVLPSYTFYFYYLFPFRKVGNRLVE